MTRTPRVLFLDHTAVLGGGEIALLNLVRHLDRDRVTPIVLLSAHGPLEKKLSEFAPTYVLPLSESVTKAKKDGLGLKSLMKVKEIFTLLKYTWTLRRFIQEHEIDLVHTNSLKSDVMGGIAGLLSGREIIWHVRDRIDEDYLPRLVVKLFRALSRMIPDYVIANSEATLRTLEPNEKQRYRVIHDGLDPSEFATNSSPTGKQDVMNVGLIGRICPWKGQHIFLEAAKIVTQKLPDCRFKVIGACLFGEQEYEREIRDLSEELVLGDVVEFTGFQADMPRVMSELDLVVHASTTGEPFGQVIIEGMAAGKPVIATNGGGAPEIVQDGVTGYLVPMGEPGALADAICKVLGNFSSACEMGRLGRQRVQEKFTIQRAAQEAQAVYEELCAQPPTMFDSREEVTEFR